MIYFPTDLKSVSGFISKWIFGKTRFIIIHLLATMMLTMLKMTIRMREHDGNCLFCDINHTRTSFRALYLTAFVICKNYYSHRVLCFIRLIRHVSISRFKFKDILWPIFIDDNPINCHRFHLSENFELFTNHYPQHHQLLNRIIHCIPISGGSVMM